MSSISAPTALLICAIALVPVACRTSSDEAAPNSVATQNTASLDVPIETIAASRRGRAILDKDFPGLRSHAMYGFFKSMSLHQIAAMSKGQMTPAMLAQANSDLSGITFVAARSDDAVAKDSLRGDSYPN